MYIDTNDRKIPPRPTLPSDKNGRPRPLPKRLLEASTSSPRPLKRTKTAPSSKDGPHILHSYKPQPPWPFPYDEDRSDGYETSDSSSIQSDGTDEDDILSESEEFLLGAVGTREGTSQRGAHGSDTEGNDAGVGDSSLSPMNSQTAAAVEDEPSEVTQKHSVERQTDSA